jgi:hypothetical protein
VVDCEYRGFVFQRHRGNCCVGLRKVISFGARGSEDSCRVPVSCESLRLQRNELCPIVLNGGGAPDKTLNDFGRDHTRDRTSYLFFDQSPQFLARGYRRRSEKIDPHRAVHQYRTRFLRMAFDSACQRRVRIKPSMHFPTLSRTGMAKAVGSSSRLVLSRVGLSAASSDRSFRSMLVLARFGLFSNFAKPWVWFGEGNR